MKWCAGLFAVFLATIVAGMNNKVSVGQLSELSNQISSSTHPISSPLGLDRNAKGVINLWGTNVQAISPDSSRHGETLPTIEIPRRFLADASGGLEDGAARHYVNRRVASPPSKWESPRMISNTLNTGKKAKLIQDDESMSKLDAFVLDTSRSGDPFNPSPRMSSNNLNTRKKAKLQDHESMSKPGTFVLDTSRSADHPSPVAQFLLRGKKFPFAIPGDMIPNLNRNVFESSLQGKNSNPCRTTRDFLSGFERAMQISSTGLPLGSPTSPLEIPALNGMSPSPKNKRTEDDNSVVQKGWRPTSKVSSLAKHDTSMGHERYSYSSWGELLSLNPINQGECTNGKSLSETSQHQAIPERANKFL